MHESLDEFKFRSDTTPELYALANFCLILAGDENMH